MVDLKTPMNLYGMSTFPVWFAMHLKGNKNLKPPRELADTFSNASRNIKSRPMTWTPQTKILTLYALQRIASNGSENE